MNDPFVLYDNYSIGFDDGIKFLCSVLESEEFNESLDNEYYAKKYLVSGHEILKLLKDKYNV